MVWCPEHCVYLHGKKARELHEQKYRCFFLANYTPIRNPLRKYNSRKNGESNADHKTKYFSRRERGKRSVSRTNKMKGK